MVSVKVRRLILKVRKLLYVLASFDAGLYKAIFCGVAPSLEHKDALSNIGNIDLFVDVGANRGQFSIYASRLFANADFFCFEPLSVPFDVSKKLLKGDRFALERVALGAGSYKTAMNISAHDDSSSILGMRSKQTETFSGTGFVGSEGIDVVSLDDALAHRHIDKPERAFLKIDVQGFELEVLEGAKEKLQYFEWIYCECSFVELYAGQPLASTVIAWLQDRSFIVKGVYNTFKTPSGECIQADFLFRRS